jgi:hypothetical protein
VRQADQRQRVIRLDDVGARPHPVRIVTAREFIYIDDDVPLRLLAAITLQRGSRHNPRGLPRRARSCRGTRRVVAHTDAGVGVEHLQRFRTSARSGPRLAPKGGLVVLAHPVQRVITGDVLEPQMGSSATGTIVAVDCGQLRWCTSAGRTPAWPGS